MDRRGRDRQRDQQDETRQREEPRVALHLAAPAEPHRRAVRRLVAVEAGEVQPVDGVTDETEHRRQQRDRRGDDHRDGEHRAEREALHEREVHQEHAEQRDDDRAAGEHDRPARRRHCDLDRVLRLATRVQLGAVTGDDEERVVDARPEADHRGELGREARDVEHERDEQQPSEADAQREQRGHDRQPHRDHRAEREQQDHDRGEQTEQLARRRLGSQHLLDDVAAGLELHAGGSCRRHVAGEVVDGRLRDVARPPVELDGRVRDPAVARDRAPVARVGAHDRGHVGQPGDLREQRLGARPDGVGLHPGPCEHHDLGRVTRAGGEPGLQEVERVLRLDVGQLEAVRVLGPRQPAGAEDHDDRQQPQHEHPPPVENAPASEATETHSRRG